MEKSIYVVGTPGPLRESLRVLFSSLTDAPRIYEITDERFAGTVRQEQHPTLILWIMQPLQPELPKTLPFVKTHWPDVSTVVLVNDEVQAHCAESLQVDRVVTEGASASKLLAVVNDLLGASSPCRAM